MWRTKKHVTNYVVAAMTGVWFGCCRGSRWWASSSSYQLVPALSSAPPLLAEHTVARRARRWRCALSSWSVSSWWSFFVLCTSGGLRRRRCVPAWISSASATPPMHRCWLPSDRFTLILSCSYKRNSCRSGSRQSSLVVTSEILAVRGFTPIFSCRLVQNSSGQVR